MKRWLPIVMLLCEVGLAAPAVAQEGGDDQGDRSAAFQAVEGPSREQIPGAPLLLGAYALVWLVLFGFVVRVARMQTRTAAELARLDRVLAQPAPRAEGVPSDAKQA